MDLLEMEFVFIHINKTGGSSIEQALGCSTEHKTAVEKRKELGKDAWKNFFSFTIVRNPWDRAVSHYHYRVQTNQTGLGTRAISFNEWVKRAHGERAPAYYDKPKMFMPQWNWITNRRGKILVDFVGRFEHLEADFARICLKLNRQAQLPHLKPSRHGHYREYYDDASIAIIRHCFASDIENFGYEF